MSEQSDKKIKDKPDTEAAGSEEEPIAPTEPKKVKKERTAKKKKFSPKVWKFYKIEGETLQKLKKDCQRCGKGVFLAEHKDRFTCGTCGFTQFKK